MVRWTERGGPLVAAPNGGLGLATCCRELRFPINSAARSSVTGDRRDLRFARVSPDRGSRLSPRARPSLQSLILIPGVDLFAGFIPRDPVSLLNYPFELFLATVDLGEVVVGESCPTAASQRLSSASSFLQSGSSP